MANDLFADDDARSLRNFLQRGASKPHELTGRTVLALLLGFFAVIFAVNGVLVHKALSTLGGVETESSYKAGQEFDREVAMAEAQDAKQWQVDAKLTQRSDGGAFLDILARDAAGIPLAGMDAAVIFERPTDRRLDRAVTVNEDKPGHFHGGAEGMAAGQWDLVIELSRRGERQFRSVNRILLK